MPGNMKFAKVEPMQPMNPENLETGAKRHTKNDRDIRNDGSPDKGTHQDTSGHDDVLDILFPRFLF